MRGPRSTGLRRPKAIPRGGSICVLAASSPSDPGRIEQAARNLEERGYSVTIEGNVGSRHRTYLAGTDDERAEAINRAIRSDEHDAFFFARGGYGAMRIIDRIDFDAIRANPRPFLGFSDLTAILNGVASHGSSVAFHGPMLNLDFHDGLSPEIDEWLWSMMSGRQPLEWSFESDSVLQEGKAEGVLFGGCLSMQVAMIDTPWEFWIDDGIWFWEEVDEPLYRIDRMLTHLRLSGRLTALRAVMIGRLKGCESPVEGEFEELLRETFGKADIPVIYNLPFGHHGDNLTLPIGHVGRVDTGSCVIRFDSAAVESPGTQVD